MGSLEMRLWVVFLAKKRVHINKQRSSQELTELERTFGAPPLFFLVLLEGSLNKSESSICEVCLPQSGLPLSSVSLSFAPKVWYPPWMETNVLRMGGVLPRHTSATSYRSECEGTGLGWPWLGLRTIVQSCPSHPGNLQPWDGSWNQSSQLQPVYEREAGLRTDSEVLLFWNKRDLLLLTGFIFHYNNYKP